MIFRAYIQNHNIYISSLIAKFRNKYFKFLLFEKKLLEQSEKHMIKTV